MDTLLNELANTIAEVDLVGAHSHAREVHWILGVILVLVTIFFGYTGYLLPWDSLGFAAAARLGLLSKAMGN
mgnify:CR=1 FL=1